MPKQTAKTNSAFVRLRPSVRDRLRRHCAARGILMADVVSKVLADYLTSCKHGARAARAIQAEE